MTKTYIYKSSKRGFTKMKKSLKDKIIKSLVTIGAIAMLPNCDENSGGLKIIATDYINAISIESVCMPAEIAENTSGSCQLQVTNPKNRPLTYSWEGGIGKIDSTGKISWDVGEVIQDTTYSNLVKVCDDWKNCASATKNTTIENIVLEEPITPIITEPESVAGACGVEAFFDANSNVEGNGGIYSAQFVDNPDGFLTNLSIDPLTGEGRYFPDCNSDKQGSMKIENDRLVGERIVPLSHFFNFVDNAWDLEKFLYNGIYISTQNTSPTDLFFKPDGTKLYYTDDLGDKIYQSTLSTPWDLSTATYDLSIPSTDSEPYSPQDLFFSSDGTKLYEAGYASYKIKQSSCSNPWDLSSCIYDEIDLQMKGSPTYGIFFKPDGSKLYEIGYNSGNSYIYQSTCSNPWDLSSCIYDNIYISTQNFGSTDLFFKPDGSKLYHSGTALEDKIYQYSLSTPWDISTATYDNINLTTQSQGVHGIFFKPDGTGLYEIDMVSDKIYQYSL